MGFALYLLIAEEYSAHEGELGIRIPRSHRVCKCERLILGNHISFCHRKNNQDAASDGLVNPLYYNALPKVTFYSVKGNLWCVKTSPSVQSMVTIGFFCPYLHHFVMIEYKILIISFCCIMLLWFRVCICFCL